MPDLESILPSMRPPMHGWAPAPVRITHSRPQTASMERPGTTASGRSGASSRPFTSRPGTAHSARLVVPGRKVEHSKWRDSTDGYDVPRDDMYDSVMEDAKRPFSATVRRPTTIMYANIADKMSIQQEDLKRRQHGWTMEEPPNDIIHLMTYMRQRASNASVFLYEFFRDYDPYRRGFISESDFFRGIDAVRCFSDMSMPERIMLLHTFSERRPNNFKKQIFNYAAFCEILQPCNQPTDTRISMLPRYQRLKEVLYAFNPNMSLDSPFAIQPLTAEGENRVMFLMGKLHHKVVSTRVSARELLGDYDPHLNGGTVGWMKKTMKTTQFMCNVPGCISYSQYMRGMVRLAGNLGLTTDDLDLIYAKYERNGAFNYYAFCHHLDHWWEFVTAAERAQQESPEPVIQDDVLDDGGYE